MAKGTVESFIATEGTGTIRADDGQVFFVHSEDLLQAPMTLEHGERVEFEIATSNGQSRAVDVHRI